MWMDSVSMPTRQQIHGRYNQQRGHTASPTHYTIWYVSPPVTCSSTETERESERLILVCSLNLIGRCDTAMSVPSVFATTQDYIWLKAQLSLSSRSLSRNIKSIIDPVTLYVMGD
jgi:hypothetical protein